MKNAAVGMKMDYNHSGREHRVIGFQLDGMDEMGWVEVGAQRNHQFHYFDLTLRQQW